MQESKGSPTLADLLGVLLENKGSDLHIQSGEVPIGRINGKLGRFEMPALTETDVLRLTREVLGNDEKMQEFSVSKDYDTAIVIPNLGRFASISSTSEIGRAWCCEPSARRFPPLRNSSCPMC